jgi:hypothetical protein
MNTAQTKEAHNKMNNSCSLHAKIKHKFLRQVHT